MLAKDLLGVKTLLKQTAPDVLGAKFQRLAHYAEPSSQRPLGVGYTQLDEQLGRKQLPVNFAVLLPAIKARATTIRQLPGSELEKEVVLVDVVETNLYHFSLLERHNHPDC